jgi:hypothetical protein
MKPPGRFDSAGALDSMNILRKGGRPRKAGPREPSGRPSRRVSSETHRRRIAQASWKSFTASAGPSLRRIALEGLTFSGGFGDPVNIPDHPLLRFVELGKLDKNVFTVALSLPKIISGRIDDAGRPIRVWQQCFQTAEWLDLAVHSCLEPDACAPRCSRPHTSRKFASDALLRRPAGGRGIRGA